MMWRRISKVKPEVKTEISLSNAKSNKQPSLGIDHLFAITRRLEARVCSLEEQISTCRRDLNRIDKKVYRDATSIPENFIEAKQKPPILIPGLEGIELALPEL